MSEATPPAAPPPRRPPPGEDAKVVIDVQGLVSRFGDNLVHDGLDLQVRRGEVLDRVSFPLGVLRIAALRTGSKGTLGRRVAKLIAQAGWSRPPCAKCRRQTR